MYAILRTKKIKSFSDIKNVENHNTRKYRVENSDPTKTKNNIVFVQSDDFAESTKKRIGDRTIRKNAVYGIELLMTASPEFFRDNADDYGVYDEQKVKEFNLNAMKFLKAEFGEQNIISAICHLDEATPHIQALITPIDPATDRLNAAKWLDGRKKMQELQDRYFDFMSPLGLERGLKGSESEHVTIKQFYGAIESAETPKLTVEVSKPPLLTDRKKWASKESYRVKTDIGRDIGTITNKAAVASINKKRALEYEKTAKNAISELERMKAEASQIRDIDLRTILEKYEAKRVSNGVYEVFGENISISGPKFHNHYNGKSGGGAIDLVMHLENINFKEAVMRLAHDFTPSAASSAAMKKVRDDVQEFVKKPKSTNIGIPFPPNWHQARTWLIEKRGIKANVVDQAYDKKRVFADYKNNVCFNYKNGIELVGTQPGLKWRGFRGKKDEGFTLAAQENNTKTVILVESALDAYSLKILIFNEKKFEKYKNFDVVAIGGTGWKTTAEIAKNYKKVILALDNDNAGDKACSDINISLKNTGIDIERLRPTEKDWNDYFKPDHEKATRDNGLDQDFENSLTL